MEETHQCGYCTISVVYTYFVGRVKRCQVNTIITSLYYVILLSSLCWADYQCCVTVIVTESLRLVNGCDYKLVTLVLTHIVDLFAGSHVVWQNDIVLDSRSRACRRMRCNELPRPWFLVAWCHVMTSADATWQSHETYDLHFTSLHNGDNHHLNCRLTIFKQQPNKTWIHVTSFVKQNW